MKTIAYDVNHSSDAFRSVCLLLAMESFMQCRRIVGHTKYAPTFMRPMCHVSMGNCMSKVSIRWPYALPLGWKWEIHA